MGEYPNDIHVHAHWGEGAECRLVPKVSSYTGFEVVCDELEVSLMTAAEEGP